MLSCGPNEIECQTNGGCCDDPKDFCYDPITKNSRFGGINSKFFPKGNIGIA